jgi:hypothetical protein
VSPPPADFPVERCPSALPPAAVVRERVQRALNRPQPERRRQAHDKPFLQRLREAGL